MHGSAATVRGLVMGLALGSIVGTARSSAPPAAEAVRATLQAEHDAGRFDGVALVARGATLVGEFAFGQANRAFQVPHRVDERFPIASVTKQFVAVLILQLVEQGKVGLDDLVATHLPPGSKPWPRFVTLRHLLTHTSGLPQPDAVIPDFYQKADLAPNALALARLLAVMEPPAKPGGAFSYNNTDYIYLAAVIEAVQGVSLPEALRIAIVEPAGLKTTGIIQGREVIAGLPEDYDLDPPPVKTTPHFELANFSGAGAGYASVRDLWAFDRALMAHTLLKPETTALMLKSSPQTSYAALGCWVYPLKAAGGKTYRIVERHGAIGGYNIVNLFVPETGACVILASNISQFVDPQTWNKQGLAYQVLLQVLE